MICKMTISFYVLCKIKSPLLCAMLKNGLCYVLCKTPLRGPISPFDFNELNSTLFTTIFDDPAVNYSAKTCLSCKSYDHCVSNCPFPAKPAITRSPSDAKTQRSNPSKRPSQPWFHEGNEGCNNYQTGNCHFSSCERAHVCRKCNGPDPMFKCKSCT